jgi:hypothetical protein
MSLTLRALNRATLARQMLLARERVDVTTAVERVAGMQAQVPKPPFIGLWSRLEGFQRQQLASAITRREVLRATMMRGTIHLVSRADFLAWRSALQPMLTRGYQAIAKGSEPLDIEALNAAGRQFFDAEPRPFEAFRDHLVERFPGRNERQLAYAVRMHLPLAMVPDESTWSYAANAAFAVADTFLGATAAASESAAELALRYLAAFGPATAADFQAWSGLGGGGALFEELRPQLETLRDERGRELFDLPGAPRPGEEREAPVRFLPEYDNLLLAHADRTRIIADEHRPLVATKNLRILATFLVDGVVAGIWSVVRKRKSAVLKLEPFAKLGREARKALVAEGERLLRFSEEDATEFVVE